MMYCDSCTYLRPTEAEQSEVYKTEHTHPPHICTKYNVRVMHLGLHPHIVPCEQCQQDSIREEGV